MDLSRETRTRDGRTWRLGRAEDVAWINDATSEGPGNGIDMTIPELYETYWTIDAPGTADHDQSRALALELDTAVVSVFADLTRPQPWWLGFLERGIGVNLVFDDAPRFNVVNGGHVLIEAGPEQAIEWRDDQWGWPHGPLPDVMFPADRSWLVVTGWDDYWMSVGGPRELLAAFVSHPLLSGYVHQVAYDDADATPPGHDVWWHRDT